jgi:hypothetical protein
LAPTDRNLLLRAAVGVFLMRAGLATIGYAKLVRFLSRLQRAESSPRPGSTSDLDRTVWAVAAAGRLLLGDRPCLPLAMTTQWLLRRRGFSTDLRIGVMRDPSGHLEAHAWVEQNGRILIGQTPALQEFQPLPALSLWT